MISASLHRKTQKLLKELIRLESVNPSLVPGGSGEEKIAGYIHRHLKKIGILSIKQNVTARRFNIIGTMKGTGSGKTLLLNGHMDTVGISGMTDDPLKAVSRNGMITGRGSADMKSGIAAMLAACEGLLSGNLRPAGDVILSFVVDEEYRSIGTEKLLETTRADGAIVCEPTDLKIGLAHKGFVWADINVLGKSAHGSRPDEGIDAIRKTGEILSRLCLLEKKWIEKPGHPLLGYPSVHCSTIRGGKELSTYPDFCQIQMERRTIPGETGQSFQTELNDLIGKIREDDPEFRAEAAVTFERPPMETGPDEAIVRSLQKACREAMGTNPELAGISWWMDSALISAAGIPAVAFGPAGTGLHGAAEAVDFASVMTTADALARTILEFCRI